MKTTIYSVFTILLVVLVSSCGKDDVELVSPEYRNIQISCGSEFEIPVLTSDWSIESVRDASSGVSMIDEQSNPLTLDGFGKVEAANKWLALERKEDTQLIVHLKENFAEQKRGIVICINNNGDRDYVTIEQSRGESYKLVKTEFQEIEELRDIYESDEGCHKLTFNNYSPEAIWQPVSSVFSDVVYKSEFKSDDYGAFDWLSGEELEIKLPDIKIDDKIWWNEACIYAPGVSTRPDRQFIQDKIKIPPYATIYFRGKVEYCKRSFNYIFTIENQSTGSRFEIKGTCMQISPLTTSLIASDKPE